MKVGIVGRIGGTVNASSQDISASIQNFIQCLINEGIEPIIESQTALNFLPNVDIQNYYILELSTKVDMIVVFGGDELEDVGVGHRHHAHVGPAAEGPLLDRPRRLREDPPEADRPAGPPTR